MNRSENDPPLRAGFLRWPEPLPATALERAFELARSGRYITVTEIRAQLIREGFDSKQVQGDSVSLQLRTLMRKAPGLRPPMISKAYPRNLALQCPTGPAG